MNFTSLTHSFFALEEDLNLLEKKIDGVYFWELIRFDIHREILQAKGVFGQKPKNNKLRKNNYNIKNSLKNIVYKNPFFTPKCDILFLGVSRRRKLEDKLWWDIFCDPVIDCLENDFNCTLLEEPYANTHKTPSKTQRIRYLEIISFICSLFKKTKIISFKLPDNEISYLRKMQECIYEKFEVSIDVEKKVTGILHYRKIVLPLYIRLLKKIKPKMLVILTSYIGLREFFIEACQNLNIPVVELQHGVSTGPYHLGYCFHNGNFTKRLFPDYFFVFGDFWKSRIVYPINQNNVISVGYPFHELEVAKYAHVRQINQIIFISQWINGNQLSKFAVGLHERLGSSIEIVYKLHPDEYPGWKSAYPWLINTRIKVIVDDSVPLYKLLQQSRIMVGVNSSVIYEGLGIGLNTILINLPGIEYMAELIELKAVLVANTIDELTDYIQKSTAGVENKAGLFKKNSLNNINQSINHILYNTGGCFEQSQT